MRKILVPTDFSDNAFNALKYACQVFKYEKCEIFIMHAYADEVYQQDKLTLAHSTKAEWFHNIIVPHPMGNLAQ